MSDPWIEVGTQDITLVTDRTRGWPADDVSDDAPLPRGARVGRYLVLGELGRGGMGIVYRAYDPQLDRPLALKRLRSRNTPADSPAHARLRREAQTLARLSDPHVVTVFDVGEDEAGLFLVMELVDGQDLAAWLREGPHPWPEVVRRMVDAGRGLAAAHRVGVVHRDFKPANVLMAEDGRVAVTDFGLARPDGTATAAPSSGGTEARSSDPALTDFGVQVGTPAYMAPEQHAGEAAGPAADQYAFCVTLFEALFGRRPFEGSNAALLAADKRDGVVQWPDDSELPQSVPLRLRRLLTRGLRVDPAQRFRSMDDLLARLDPDTRHRGTAAAAVLVLGAIAVFGVTRSQAGEDPCAQSEHALADHWSEDHRQAIQARLAAADLPYAEHAARTTPPRLDAWAERWTSTHREVCEATWRRGEQSAPALDVRMRCLDDGRQALDAAVKALADGPDEALAHATELTLALPAPEACRRQPVPSTAPTSPTTPDSRVRTRLAELDALRRTGLGRQALDEAEALVREVGAGLAPDEGAALYYTLGVLRDDAGDFGGAQQALQESARLARTRADPIQEADAWIELTRIVGAHQHDAQQGRRFGELALATLEAAGDEPSRRADALLELGEVSFRSGDDPQTLKHWSEALALRREQYGTEDVRVAQIEARLAGVDLRRGDMDSARRRLEQVIERYRQTFGPGHPRIAAPLGNLGFVLSAQGEHEAALEHMRHATEIATRTRGPHHPQVAGGRDAIGHVLTQAGRPEEAEPEFVAAIEGFERSLGPEHPAVATPLLGLGRVRVTLGRPDEAVAPLERALGLAEAADLPPVQVAETRFHLARALELRDPERSDALAHQALAVFDEALAPSDERWPEIRAWKARHAVTP